MNKKKISIVILTFNGEKTIEELLRCINSQSIKPMEIIVLDSDSTDNTCNIVKKFTCKIIPIRKNEFGHGKTRNYGVRTAKGEIVVFITQDAIPKNKMWLENLTSNVGKGKIIASFGKQVPKKDASDLEIFSVNFAYPSTDSTWDFDNIENCPNIFSDSNSAILRSVLLKFPFKNNILVSEDHEWAIRMLEKGYQIKYESKAAVFHSHTYNFTQTFRRFFDIGAAEKDINSKISIGKSIKTNDYISKQILFLRNKKKIYLFPIAMSYNIAKYFGLQFGRNNRFIPRFLKRQMSDYKNMW